MTALTQWVALNLACEDTLNDVAVEINGEVTALAELLDTWEPNWRSFTQERLGAADVSDLQLDPDGPCPHLEFEAGVSIDRIMGAEADPLAIVGYYASVQIACRACDEPFRWTGVKPGMSPREPRMSVDGLTLHVPFRPATADADFGQGLPGFDVNLLGPAVGHEATVDAVRRRALQDAAQIVRGRIDPTKNSIGANRELRHAAAHLERAASEVGADD